MVVTSEALYKCVYYYYYLVCRKSSRQAVEDYSAVYHACL